MSRGRACARPDKRGDVRFKMAPKVSVLIPTYNYARYLPEAIESVLSQSFTDFELIILDDHSTDETAEILARYAAQDGRISFKINPHNLGMVSNWNKCLGEAAGEYVKYLFADDLLCSADALRLMVTALDEEPAASMVASARSIIDSAGRRNTVMAPFGDSALIDGGWVISRCLGWQKNLIGEPTAVMFRKCFSGDGFNPKLRQIVDMEFWFRLLEKGGLAYIGRPLVAFRKHIGQQTVSNSLNPLVMEDTERLLAEYAFNDVKHYIDLSPLRKIYLLYDYNYQIWRLQRQGVLERSLAREKIASGYGWGRFVSGYPLYKLFKPLNKLFFLMRQSTPPGKVRR